MTSPPSVAGVACALLFSACAPMDSAESTGEPRTVYRDSVACRASANVGGQLAWAHFNNPDRPCAQDPRIPGDANIEGELIRLIHSAPQGSTIRGNIYAIKSLPMAQAFEQAVDRGVHVVLSLDGSRDQNEAQLIVRNLPAARVCRAPDPDGTTHGCISNVPGAIAHTKLFTFSQVRAPDSSSMTPAVWFGSFNLTVGRDGSRGFNNTITVYGDGSLFLNLDGHARRMWEAASDPGERADHIEPMTASFDPTFLVQRPLRVSARVQASPNTKREGDLVVDSLLETLPGPNCSVLAAEAWLTVGRSAVTRKLVAMKEAGCDVRFVGIESHLDKSEVERLTAAGIRVRVGTVHDKFLIVKGTSARTSKHEFRVITGSHNLEASAESNDELLAELASEGEASHPLYDAYEAHFEEAWAAASPISDRH